MFEAQLTELLCEVYPEVLKRDRKFTRTDHLLSTPQLIPATYPMLPDDNTTTLSLEERLCATKKFAKEPGFAHTPAIFCLGQAGLLVLPAIELSPNCSSFSSHS
jgi:hypothetical protein